MQLAEKIVIYTDGACRGNPGIGSWAAILICGEYEKKIAKVELETTNNRMELSAAIMGLIEIKNKNKPIDIFSDSKYVIKGINQWIYQWQKNDWQIAQKKQIRNLDLWKKLYSLNLKLKPNWYWVKGHSGDIGNERVDKLANQVIDQYLIQNKG